jgi:hypothetical protein
MRKTIGVQNALDSGCALIDDRTSLVFRPNRNGFMFERPGDKTVRRIANAVNIAGVSQVAKNEWYWIAIGRRMPSRPTSAQPHSLTSGDQRLALW